MNQIYFTIAGTSHYYGDEFVEPGMKVRLVKEPDNEYDREAIKEGEVLYVLPKGILCTLHQIEED